MSPQKVLILGAGAAGAAAARVLHGSGTVSVTLVDRTGQAPYNRTLVNKGVAIGLLTPEQVVTPGVEVISDTAVEVDPQGKTVRLASGRIEPYDALLLATGSTPRLLPDTLPGLTAATEAGRVTTLHSLEDAVAVRDLLGTLGRPAQIVISGAGLVAAETATLLRDRGHQVTLLARATTPGVSVFGAGAAERLAAAHREHVDVAFGRTLTAVTDTGTQLELALDDTTQLTADLLIIAHGTTPTGPAPWEVGVIVDGKLRTATPGVYSAGGVAAHYDTTLGAWRIDHWSDAAAQGEHAARTMLADLGAGTHPGDYQPRAPFTATVHGMMVAGAGITGGHTSARIDTTDPLLVVHEHDGVPVGVLGLDAVPAVFGWMPNLHTPAATDPQDLASAGTATADSHQR